MHPNVPDPTTGSYQRVRHNPVVGLQDAEHLLEDILDYIGLTFEQFRREIAGGWLFGYADALRSAGADSVLLFASARVRAPRRFLSAADVYAFPSRHEGFPVAPIEAMACGPPVVAADAPGVSDIFAEGERSGGVVVSREDPTALAAALARVLGDADLRQRLGRAARERARDAFSLEAVGRELRDFILDGDRRGL